MVAVSGRRSDPHPRAGETDYSTERAGELGVRCASRLAVCWELPSIDSVTMPGGQQHS